jgi:hypothetical protein
VERLLMKFVKKEPKLVELKPAEAKPSGQS